MKIERQKSKANKNITFESSEELDSLKENDSASGRSEKKARTAFGVKSRTKYNCKKKQKHIKPKKV